MNCLESTILPYLQIEENGQESDIDPQQEISNLLTEFSGSGITDLQVVDADLTVLGTSDTTQQNIIGQLSDDVDLRQAQITENSITRQVIGFRHSKQKMENSGTRFF
ncbi:MAG: hypothetical protein U5K84_13380 [Alkalibacterium sp.]|nr:hypothetical protein [Alkalibacterium sp.]